MTKHADISPLSRLLMRIDAAADGERIGEGIPTGFRSLDDLLGGGLRRGDLVVLAGDVGAGKSALALAIALRVRAAGRPVLMLCGEMAPDRVFERALALEGRARIDDLRRGAVNEETRAHLGAAALRMRDILPVIDRIPGGGPGNLALLLDGVPDAELLVLDSLQCLAPGAAPHSEELAAAVTALKTLAMDRDIAVLTTAHLSGRPATAGDSRPTLEDMGALGTVKQLADVVLGIHREEMYDAGRGNEGATELLVLKNRHGPTSYIDLYFYKQWLRFEDMLDPDR